MNIFKRIVVALVVLFSSTAIARVDIDLQAADVVIVDAETLLIRNVEAVNFGSYWSLFKWNAEAMTFELQEFGLQDAVEDFCRDSTSPAVCQSQSVSGVP